MNCIRGLCDTTLAKEYAKDVFQTFDLTKEELLTKTKSKIYLAHQSKDSSVKKVVKYCRRNEASSHRFYTEISIMKKLRHPNIMVFEEAASFPDHHAMVLPYCSRGALYNMIGKVGFHYTEHYFLQICSAVKYLHQIGVVHRDIKLDNVLVDDSHVVYLTDFDMSCQLDPECETVHNIAGTQPYLAPEMIQFPKGSYNGFKLDIYALGVLLFCLIFEKDVQERLDYLDMVMTYIWTFPVHFYKSILECMLEPDPGARWDMSSLISGLSKASWLVNRLRKL